MLKPFTAIALFAAAGVAYYALNLPVVALIVGAIGLVFFFQTLFAQRKESGRISEQTKATDSQLRTEVIAVQKLAMEKLSGAGDEVKTKVASMVADAAKHLGYPPSSGMRVESTDRVLNWNKEGLRLIAQARQVVEEYQALHTA